jgi:hypothetical protein
MLAGIHLNQVRNSPVLQKVFAQWLPLLDRAGEASDVLIAYNGKDLLWAGSGPFHTAPPGATLLNPQLAVAGPASAVRAATAQQATGKTGAPALVAQAEPVASQPIWAVLAGGAPLPLSGNAANVNRLLALTEYTRFAIELNSGLTLRATGICRSAGQARQLEQTIRGMVTLAGAATHDPTLSGILGSFEIRTDGSSVYASLSGTPEALERLLDSVAR